MKIAIAGQMASGKTTLANKMQEELISLDYRVERHSLATKVKEIGSNLFGMVEKDRKLLQQIGMKMREIRPDVWIDYMNRTIDEDFATDKYDVAIVDDVRFINEAEKLSAQGWRIVRLHLDEDLQRERLKKTYPDWEVHWANRNDPSETEVSQIPEDYIWLNIMASDSDAVFEAIQVLGNRNKHKFQFWHGSKNPDIFKYPIGILLVITNGYTFRKSWDTIFRKVLIFDGQHFTYDVISVFPLLLLFSMSSGALAKNSCPALVTTFQTGRFKSIPASDITPL